jgi:hypothetical protein
MAPHELMDGLYPILLCMTRLKPCHPVRKNVISLLTLQLLEAAIQLRTDTSAYESFNFSLTQLIP